MIKPKMQLKLKLTFVATLMNEKIDNPRKLLSNMAIHNAPGISRQEFAIGIMELSHNILPRFDRLEKQLNEQRERDRKLILLISQIYKDNESNKDTLNKLDKFLEEYYENPYDDGNL